MTFSFHGLWLLCALATVVFAAAAGRDRRQVLALAVGLAVGVLLSRSGLPDPAATGVMAVVAVGILLFRPRYAIAAAGLGGVIAGMLTSLIEAQAVPPLAAPLVPSALVAASIWLTRTRDGFAPARLVDEGLLAVGALALAVATLPSILDGWQTAVALSATSTRQATVALPLWTAAFIVASMSLGGLYSVWSRR